MLQRYILQFSILHPLLNLLYHLIRSKLVCSGLLFVDFLHGLSAMQSEILNDLLGLSPFLTFLTELKSLFISLGLFIFAKSVCAL